MYLPSMQPKYNSTVTPDYYLDGLRIIITVTAITAGCYLQYMITYTVITTVTNSNL